MISDLIYDVGMHNGDDTAYYLSLGYKVIAIDASPELVAKAKTRFNAQIKENKLEVLNIGIDSKEGLLDFYLNKTDSVWNSFNKEIATRGGEDYEIIKIKTNSIDHLMKERGVPHYMKIDIEGNDILCLTSLFNCEEKPCFISVELSDIVLINKLHELGYTKFKIIEQSSLLPLEIPLSKEYEAYRTHKAFQHSMKLYIRIVRKIFGKYINRNLERKYKYLFNYNHPFGSSGTFGKLLSGKWLNFEEASKVYLFYKNYYNNTPGNIDYGFWVDIHATKTEEK